MVTNAVDVPAPVRERYKELKEEYDFCITLKTIGKRYYVYKATTVWDKEKKTARSHTAYMGRITDDGIFAEKELSGDSDTNSKAKSRDPKQTAPQLQPQDPPHNFIPNDRIDDSLLTILSTNARADLSYFGRKLGLRPSETYRRVKQLEQKYGLGYIAEIDTRKLGYFSFFIRVNFLRKSPTEKEILTATSKEPNIQLVQTLSGYGILLYVLARDNNEIADIRRRIRLALGKYSSKWSTTPGSFHFGFIPLRDEFLEQLRGKVLGREYAVLRELNKKGTMEFTEIDKKYGFDEGRALYTYHKLRENGTLLRITTTMQKAPIKYLGLLLEYILNYKKFDRVRKRSLLDILGESKTVLNKYILTGGIESPSGAVFFVPVFRDGELDGIIKRLEEMKDGVRVRSFIITNKILGDLCYRKIDPTNTILYSRLANEYNVKLPPRIDYEQTGRTAKREKRSKKTLERGIFIEEQPLTEQPIWE